MIIGAAVHPMPPILQTEPTVKNRSRPLSRPALALFWTLALSAAPALIAGAFDGFPLSLGLSAAAAPNSASTAKEKAKAESRKADVEKRLSDLQKSLSEREAQTEEANKELQKADQAISEANKRLRELKTERQSVEVRLAQLQKDGRAVGVDLAEAEGLIDQIARAQYLNLRKLHWQSVIDGGNPNEQSRTSASLAYLAHAQQRAIGELESERSRIQRVSSETQKHQNELKAIAQEEEKNRRELVADKRARQQAVQRLSREITSQQQMIDKLKKDQSRLGGLIALIDKKLAAERAQEEAAAKRRQAESERAAAEAKQQKPIPLMKGGSFASLKGKLSRPVSGRVAANFGETRTGSAKWQGILIRAPEGAEVSACAAGTVVFSDWLRGYGNLLIIDHGSTYMTVYANNESVLKNVGDKVRQGEAIASVGKSGIGDEPGLYFEIRYKGKPINPTPWLRK